MGNQRSKHGRLWMVCIVLGLLVAIAGVFVYTTARSTVRVKVIQVEIDPSTPIGDHLLLHQIHVGLDSQTYGSPFSTKMYAATIEVEVTNLTDQPQEVAVYYYYDAGNIGFYSPGAGSRSRTMTVAPGYSGPVQCPIEIQRPVEGAALEVGVSASSQPGPYGKSPGEFSEKFGLEFVQ